MYDWHWKAGRLVNETIHASISIAEAYHLMPANHRIAEACKEVLIPYDPLQDT